MVKLVIKFELSVGICGNAFAHLQFIVKSKFRGNALRHLNADNRMSTLEKQPPS